MTAYDQLPAKIAEASARLRALEAGISDALAKKDITTYNYLLGQAVNLKSAISGMESRLTGPVGNTSIHLPRRNA